MPKINIFTEVLEDEKTKADYELDLPQVIDKTRSLLEYYISDIVSESCLNGLEYESITLDIVFCDSEKTHELNRDYRNKDYPADIITFAIFADDENSFIFDGDVNLGEIIIAMDKVMEGVNRDISNSKNWKQELFFLISHGLMHLLGFDHQTEEEYNFVIAEQKKALEYIGYDKI
jgi:probable rRNA maturation factor